MSRNGTGNGVETAPPVLRETVTVVCGMLEGKKVALRTEESRLPLELTAAPQYVALGTGRVEER